MTDHRPSDLRTGGLIRKLHVQIFIYILDTFLEAESPSTAADSKLTVNPGINCEAPFKETSVPRSNSDLDGRTDEQKTVGMVVSSENFLAPHKIFNF